MKELDEIFEDKEFKEYTKKGASLESVKEYYNNFVNDSEMRKFLEDGKQWVNEDDRKQFVTNYLHKEFNLRPPVKPYTFIPIGMEPVKTSKSKSVYSGLIVTMASRSGKAKIHRIGINGKEACDILKKVQLWHMYENVLIGKPQAGDDFIMDERAAPGFENPQRIKATEKQIIEKLELPRVPKLSELKDFISDKGSDGWTIRTDLKIVRGMVMRTPWTKDENPYDEGGSYRISDMSIDADDPIVTPSGDTLPPGVTVWASPKIISHDDGDVIDFITTVDEVLDKKKKKTGEIQCNAVCELPVHSIPKSSTGPDGGDA